MKYSKKKVKSICSIIIYQTFLILLKAKLYLLVNCNTNQTVQKLVSINKQKSGCNLKISKLQTDDARCNIAKMQVIHDFQKRLKNGRHANLMSTSNLLIIERQAAVQIHTRIMFYL